MHLITFIYKVKRRLCRKGEQLFPKLFFAYRSGPSSPDRFFEQFQQVVPFIPMVNLKERLPAVEQEKLLIKANAICRHEFDLLGSGPYRFENGIDWQLDFKSGFRWPEKVVYSHCTSRTGADIKVPWELNRFNHVVTLGLAYQLSKDGKYAEEFVRQVEDWIDKNPVGYGVNWACCMDVSIRATNWMAAFSLFFDVLMKEEFRRFRRELAGSLWKHARFIRSHLEWLGSKENAGANHFLSDLTGLLTLGVFFRGTRAGERWVQFAHKELERQMQIQVLADGVHFECSPSYHRLCLEMFLWCEALARRAGRPFSDAYCERQQKMQQFVADYMKPSGVAPLIGDNDDGRLLNSGLLCMGDHGCLMPKESHGRFFIDRFLLSGVVSVQTEPIAQSAAYPDGGFYFLKNEQAYVAVRAGRLAYAGGHAHNDQLSFELNLAGRDIFVDRGTYVYTSDPEARNRYRSSVAHNVMQINGAEQNCLGSRLFGMMDETLGRVIEQKEGLLEVVHYGFRSLQRPGAEYRRKIELLPGRLKITDIAKPLNSGDRLQWRFHLAPGLTAQVFGETIHIQNEDKLICILNAFPKAVISSQDYSHSPSYGVLEEAKVLVFECVADDVPSVNEYQFKICWE